MSSGLSLPQTLAIMVSGAGSNLRAIVEACEGGRLSLHPTVVISDQPAAPALAYAREAGIAVLPIPIWNYPDREAWERDLADHLAALEPDLVALAGFMRVLSPDGVARFAGRMVNIHPSLLPRHPGLHPHRQALKAGDPVHGATVHLVTAVVDAGPRIAQIRVPVMAGDDETALIERTKSAEHRLYPLVLEWIARGRLVLTADAVFQNGVKLVEPILVNDLI